MSDDVNFIILDGKELKINDRIKDVTTNTYKLNIYGQSNQTGKLTSNNSGDGVYNFEALAELNIHSAQVVTTYTGSMGPAMLNISKLNVYAGSLLVESTFMGYGVKFGSEFNVYGGKVTVTGRSDYAIEGGAGAIISVKGGELYVVNSNSKKAIDGTNVTLNFVSGLTGKAGAYVDGWETDASWGTSIATGYTGTDRCVKVTP